MRRASVILSPRADQLIAWDQPSTGGLRHYAHFFDPAPTARWHRVLNEVLAIRASGRQSIRNVGLALRASGAIGFRIEPSCGP